jgi:hypothetical protein
MTVITPVKFPSDADLQAYYSCDTLPAIPDNAAGTTYLSNFATTDSWNANGNTLAASGGLLRCTYGGTGASIYRNIAASPNGKMQLYKVKASGAMSISLYYYNGTALVAITTQTVSTVEIIISTYLAAGAANSVIYIDSTGGAGTWFELSAVYIGSGLYDTKVIDNSGNGRDLVSLGAVPIPGISGNGLLFNGLSSYLSGTITDFSATGVFTLSAWIIGAVRTGTQYLFTRDSGSAPNRGIAIRLTDNKPLFIISPDGTALTSLSADAGSECTANCLLTFVFVPSVGMYIYKNGVLIKSLTTGVPALAYYSASQAVRMGSVATALIFSGWMDEIRLYTRALDPNEILGLYQQIVRPSYSNVALSSDRNRTSQANIFITELTASGFNLVSVIDNYRNLLYEQSLSGVGTFSFSMLADSLQASAVKVNSFVIIGASYGLTQARVGIIQSVDRGISSDSLQTINVTGFEAKGMLSWRIILPNAGSAYYTITDDAETIFKDVLAHQGGSSSADTSRIFTSLSIAPTQGRGSTYVFAERYTNLASVFERLSLAAEMGWSIKWDATGLLFDVIVGKNRTIGNNVYAPAILSTNVDTVNESHFVENEQTYKTYNYVGGAGAGAARTIRTAYLGGSAPSSIARKEIFTDARDLASSSDLDSRGAAVLAENAYTRYVEATVNPFSLFMASSGAELGDYITVESSGYQQTCQITSITEQWGDNGYEMELKLDKQPNTIVNAVTGQKLYTDRLAASLG